MRIVSLIASATEIVHSLGLSEFQVGRSHECDYPESVRALPVCTEPRFAIDGSSSEIDKLVKQTLHDVGSVYHVHDELLASLEPTHILTQTQCKVCAVSLDDVERALSSRFPRKPAVIGLQPDSLEEIYADIQRVADACQITDQGRRFVAKMQEDMAVLSRRAATASRKPRVAVIEWLEPLMAAGNWTPHLLDMANSVNLFGEARKHSPWMKWEQLVAADPDMLLITACGFDVPRTRQEMYWLTNRPDWRELRAVRDQQVYLADGNQFFNRPGPRVVDTLRILCEILHPDVFPSCGIGWESLK